MAGGGWLGPRQLCQPAARREKKGGWVRDGGGNLTSDAPGILDRVWTDDLCHTLTDWAIRDPEVVLVLLQWGCAQSWELMLTQGCAAGLSLWGGGRAAAGALTYVTAVIGVLTWGVGHSRAAARGTAVAYGHLCLLWQHLPCVRRWAWRPLSQQ